jgi:fluoride exporter
MPDWLISFATHPVTLLAVGGGVGANARYWFGRLVIRIQGEVEFPWATFIINVAGSVILGFVVAGFLHQSDPLRGEPARRNWYLLLATGFCGGFTTFSAFSYETLKLMQDGRMWAAAVYVVGSVVCGLLGVWLALKLAGDRGVG